jgi:hypothetical protein
MQVFGLPGHVIRNGRSSAGGKQSPRNIQQFSDLTYRLATN